MSELDQQMQTFTRRAKSRVVKRSIPIPGDTQIVTAPTFPDRIVDIRNHGAVPGGNINCTIAIAGAIAACADRGGGRVIVPAGTWLTGPIHLKSNIELHLSEGAELVFTDNPDDYLPTVFVRWQGQECFNYSPLIYARGCENVAITGTGRLKGSGEAWWRWEKLEQLSGQRLYRMVLDNVEVADRRFGSPDQPLRPQFINFIDCQNILLDGFSITEAGPFWSIHIAYGRNVTVQNLRVDTPVGPNTNAIVIDSTRDVVIQDCQLATSDDCVALKSGLNEDGWRVGKPTENVVVRRVRCTRGDGAISLGSEMSGGIRNVRIHDCSCDGVNVGIRMKAARGRGGVVEDVEFRDMEMGRINGDAIHITTEYSSFVSPDGRPPVFRDIEIRNVRCNDARIAAHMIGLADSALQNLTLENISIVASEGLFCTSGNGIKLIDVTIEPRKGPALNVRDSQDVTISGLNIKDSESVFLDLRGRKTRNIRLVGENSNRHVRPAVVLGVDVPHDAVLQE